MEVYKVGDNLMSQIFLFFVKQNIPVDSIQGQTHAWYADKPSLKLRASHWAEAPN